MDRPLNALYDANILYPAPLRDLFMRLALADLVRARWTELIHDEWIRSVLRDNPGLSADRLARTRALMNSAIRDCLVTGFESLIDTLSLPDVDDRHVLAAAIHCGADVIITFNLKDFPETILSKHGVVAQHPDDFLLDLIASDAEAVCAAIKRQRESLKNPTKSVNELLASLETVGLSRSVLQLRQHESKL